MKKIAILLCLTLCVGLMYGCACQKKADDAATTEAVSDAKETGDEAKTAVPVYTPEQTTAAPKKEDATKKGKNEAPTKKKTKAKGGDIVGSWTWEGGVFVYTFKKDGSGVYTTGSDTMYFTYTTKNNKVTLKYKDGGDITMPYTVSGKKLVLKDSNGDDVVYYKRKVK